MLTLAATETLRGVAGTASAITFTLTGDLKTTADSYQLIAQGQVPSSAGTLYTVPASTQALIQQVFLRNTTASPVSVALYVNGTAGTNQIMGLLIPANGSASLGSDGWKLYDSSGVMQYVGSIGPQGLQGEKGWSPVLAVVTDGARRVFQIVNWVGGAGTMPSVTNQFIGSAGIVATAALAEDIRGPQGAAVLAFGTVTGNTGTATADASPDSIAITGTGVISTAATDTPDGIVISSAALTGDVTTSGAAATLATVNSNTGSFGTASNVGQFTVNAKGLTTAAANVPIQLPSTAAVTGLDTALAGRAPTARLINTTAPLTGGGDLSADRTLAISPATNSTAGSMSAADKSRLSNMAFGFANVLDYGADSTGVASCTAAYNAAIAALPAGGTLFFPPGTYLENSSPYVLSANNITLLGSGENATVLKTTNTTGDQFRITGYGCKTRDIMIQGPGSVTTSNKTAGIGLDMQSTEGEVISTSFTYQASCVRIGGHLVNVEGSYCRYWTLNGIIVDHQSDHQISKVLMDNSTGTLPTGAGIDVRVTASLTMDFLNIIHANWCLNLSPTTGVTVPSVKAVNCFFDTSAIGLRIAGAGSVFRSEFTNCWFSSMTQYGILMAPSTAGNMVDGITFVNCDIYNNVAGTTVGVAVTTGNVGKWKMVGCNIAGWTTGISVVGGTAHFPTILSNTVGAVSAFAVNGTGIAVAAGTYKGLIMDSNDVVDNTTALTLGAVTPGAPGSYKITNNAGINPRGTELRPVATPVAGTTYTNNTGFKVQVMHKNSAAPSAVIINGVTYTVAFLINQVFTVSLEPGATIAFTGGTHTSWSWIGM